MQDCGGVSHAGVACISDARSNSCRHDFVVVETIDFYADEDAELPPPMTQRDVMLLNRAGPMDEEDAAPDAAAPDARGKVRDMRARQSCRRVLLCMHKIQGCMPWPRVKLSGGRESPFTGCSA